jgi:glycosyltransferase involved in cell wall biosynthesis
MISVCIATYNGEKYIRKQLLSIVSQLTQNDEIVISDDDSTDNTISIIMSINSPIIHIFKNKGAHGYTPNFENALRHAHGEYIFLSDQDDVWSEDKVNKTIKLLQQYDFVISDADIIDERGCRIAESYFNLRKSKPGVINNLIRFSYLGCSMAFRRQILKKAIPFPSNHSYCTHDNWLGIIGMIFYRTTITNEKLFHYRRHQNNTSQGGLRPTTSIWFKCRYRLYLLLWILKRFFKTT